jgi:predicted permease
MRWWQRLRRRGELEEQLDRELRFHIEQHAADLVARGARPDEALRQARLALGGPEQVKEECRDARGTRWLEDFAQDTRYALRTLRQRRGFAAVALVTLGLGIGATTLMFTVVDGVLLRPLPYAGPDRLVRLHGESATWNVSAFGRQNLALPDFRDVQRQTRSLDIAGALYSGGTVSAPGDPEYVDWREITPDLFHVLGVPLFRGRAFVATEDRPGGAPVAILGYSFWRSHFGGSADAIGASMTADGKSYTIVGIAGQAFRLQGEPDLYTPLGQDTARFLQIRRAHPISTFARLRPGYSIAQAQAELAAIGKQLREQYPDTNGERSLVCVPLRPDVGRVGGQLWLLLGAVGLVLLVACANIAGLQLARAVSRQRELAMRVALGAGRGRLARQCLTEGAVLSLCGGAVGVALAAAGVRPFVAIWPGSLPRAESIHLDASVLLVAVAVSILSGILFGLAPALRVPTRRLEQALREGGRMVGGGGRRLHDGFVVSQIALAVVLLVAAGLLGRALLRASSLDPGVNTRNVLVARMALSPATLAHADRIRAAWDDVLSRARAVPGVQAVAMVDTVPMREGNNQLAYSTTAGALPAAHPPMALASSVSPDYLRVMGIALRRGRFIDGHDRLGSEPVVVIDDVLARHAFGAEDPVGRALWIPDMANAPFRVVGVVGHVRYWGLAGDDQAEVRDQLYYPFAQVPEGMLRRWSELTSLAVRTKGRPLELLGPLRRELRGSLGDQVLYEPRTLEQLAADSLGVQRFLMLLFAIFAALALLLASIGVYGVLTYITSERIPEIGVRMALGATAGDVMRMIFRQSFRLMAGGALLGVAAAAAGSRVLVRLVAGVEIDPCAFAATLAALAIAALVASFLPARRAARVDPVKALRS